MQQSGGLLPRPVQKLVATLIFRRRRKMPRVPSDPRAKRRNGTLWDAHFRRRRKMPRVPSDLPVNIKPLPKPSAALVLVASSGYPGAPAARLNTHRTYPSALFSCGRLFASLKKHTAKCAFSDRRSFPNVSQVGTRFTLRKPAFWSDQTCR